jgi:hypothetical protein
MAGCQRLEVWFGADYNPPDRVRNSCLVGRQVKASSRPFSCRGAQMEPSFRLGKVMVKEEAAFALALAGQDAAFFLDKHAAGDWGEEDHGRNEQGLRERSLILSKYHTLRGHEILVVTFLGKGETYLICPPNSILEYVAWYDDAGRQHQGEDMKPPQGEGNGFAKFAIAQVDMGGWVRVFPASEDHVPAELGLYLSHTLAEWFRQRPQLRMRCVVPICQGGTTRELHGWYEAHVLPALQVPE